MEQKKLDRDLFWKDGGEVKDEMTDYLALTNGERDAILTEYDAFLTLICC